MKRVLSTLAFIATAAAFSGAQAGELYPLPSQDNVGVSKTRAQVQAELRAATEQHQIVAGEQNFGGDLAVTASTVSRAEVVAKARGAMLDMAFYLRG
ncbi:MAG: DUF4148 domain-containing protein [Burkholderiaceae bacterium]